jgi:hypothetical protein
MKAWLPIVKTICGTIVGVGVIVFCAWNGLTELWRWYSTGVLLASFRDGRRTVWRPVSFESDPLNFVGHLAVYTVLAVLGSVGCALACVRIWQWWHNKPKPNA